MRDSKQHALGTCKFVAARAEGAEGLSRTLSSVCSRIASTRCTVLVLCPADMAKYTQGVKLSKGTVTLQAIDHVGHLAELKKMQSMRGFVACCSLVQAIAAAQAGVSVIQPNIGRLDDWYAKHPGVIRDPKASQESTIASCSWHFGRHA